MRSLCCDISFHVATEAGHDRRFSCCDREFLCRDRVRPRGPTATRLGAHDRVGRDKAGRARKRCTRDRGILSRLRFLCRDKLRTVEKIK